MLDIDEKEIILIDRLRILLFDNGYNLSMTLRESPSGSLVYDKSLSQGKLYLSGSVKGQGIYGGFSTTCLSVYPQINARLAIDNAIIYSYTRSFRYAPLIIKLDSSNMKNLIKHLRHLGSDEGYKYREEWYNQHYNRVRLGISDIIRTYDKYPYEVE